VDLKIEIHSGVVKAVVCDDGVGFHLDEVQSPDEIGRGLGLLGMRERAEQLNGKLVIVSVPGKGTKIYARIPIEDKTHNE
jgi:two-component system sensor histidine kinase DegS